MKPFDPAILAEIARQSLGAPALQLLDWSVAPLRHEKVIETTGGLFRASGQAWDGSQARHWSAVLKILQQPGQGGLDEPGMDYWRREALAYQSGLLAELPAGVRAPRCYGVSEQPESVWIWLEDLGEDSRQRWTLEHFQRAARHLGRFAGAYLPGSRLLPGTPLPNAPWLCASLWRGFYADGDWWARFIDPASPNNAWQRPLVQEVFSEPLRARVLRIWEEKWQWIAANERLPRVFCHNDAHRLNLTLRAAADGQEELVMLDWGFCGNGALGNDLGELVGTSLSNFTADPANAAGLEESVLEGYLAGLRDAGWQGDAQLVRVGYLIALTLYWGGTLPCAVAQAQPGETRLDVEAKYGRPLAAALPGWTQLAEFALDRADEARYWINQWSP